MMMLLGGNQWGHDFCVYHELELILPTSLLSHKNSHVFLKLDN